MYPINDKEYLKTCAEIASFMSISISSAKRKVEIEIAKQGLKTIEEKRKVAKDYLNSINIDKERGHSRVELFDELMESLEGDDNFLVED